MAWQMANNMARLKSDSLVVYPGATIYGIGDPEHASGVSGHNPDDMVLPQGGRAELTDSDTKQEVRSTDHMINQHFTFQDAQKFANALVNDLTSRKRLYYVIFNHKKAGRSSSWQWVDYNGDDPHTDHVHVSGWMDDDDNTSPWQVVLNLKNPVQTLREDPQMFLVQQTASGQPAPYNSPSFVFFGDGKKHWPIMAPLTWDDVKDKLPLYKFSSVEKLKKFTGNMDDTPFDPDQVVLSPVALKDVEDAAREGASEGASVTHEELVAAAEEGANRAEDS